MKTSCNKGYVDSNVDSSNGDDTSLYHESGNIASMIEMEKRTYRFSDLRPEGLMHRQKQVGVA